MNPIIPYQQPAIIDGESYDELCFKGLRAEDTVFNNVEFYECRFEACRFFQGTFRQCSFEKCTFEQCDLSVLEVDESSFHDVRFFDSKILGTDWTHAKNPISLAFIRCNIGRSAFVKLSLQKTEISECMAHEADFTGTNLSHTNLCETDFLGARFAGTNLSYADFTAAKNYAIDPTENRVKKAIFSIPEALSLLSAFDVILK